MICLGVLGGGGGLITLGNQWPSISGEIRGGWKYVHSDVGIRLLLVYIGCKRYPSLVALTPLSWKSDKSVKIKK